MLDDGEAQQAWLIFHARWHWGSANRDARGHFWEYSTVIRISKGEACCFPCSQINVERLPEDRKSENHCFRNLWLVKYISGNYAADHSEMRLLYSFCMIQSSCRIWEQTMFACPLLIQGFKNKLIWPGCEHIVTYQARIALGGMTDMLSNNPEFTYIFGSQLVTGLQLYA